MARINWNKHHKIFTESLHAGNSVADTASLIGVSYSTFCKYLSSISMNRHGLFKKPIKNTPQLEEYFNNYIMKEFTHLQDICETFDVSSHQIQNLMRTYSVTKEWDLSTSTSENVAIGRRAEKFIKEMKEFRIVADMIKKDSKAPYDLVIADYGAVDVKATKLRNTPSGGLRWKFNVANVCKPTKYVFLLGYNEDYTEPEVLLTVPIKFIKGKKSLSVSKTKLDNSKYSKFLFKKFYSEDELEEDTLN